MNWNKWVRQIHRWFSMAFTVAVIVNVVAIVEKKYTAALGLLAVAPRGTRRPNRRLTSCAFGDDQRDVVGLFMWAEASSPIRNCCQQLRRG